MAMAATMAMEMAIAMPMVWDSAPSVSGVTGSSSTTASAVGVEARNGLHSTVLHDGSDAIVFASSLVLHVRE